MTTKKNTYYDFSRTKELEESFIKKFPWIKSRGVRIQIAFEMLLEAEKSAVMSALERVKED